jgi:hypothetical protein
MLPHSGAGLARSISKQRPQLTSEAVRSEMNRLNRHYKVRPGMNHPQMFAGRELALWICELRPDGALEFID